MPNSSPNVTWRWLAGSALGLMLTFGAYAWQSTTSTVDKNAQVVDKLTVRVTISEQKLAGQEVEIRALREQLNRMETKLDRLLEKR